MMKALYSLKRKMKMKINRKIIPAFFLATALMMEHVIAAESISIVVPFPAGGPTDFIARHFAPQLEKELNTIVIVENKPGASGNIGMQYVAKKQDATLVHTTAAMQAVNPLMYPNSKFHPKQDLIPVGITGAMPNVLVVHPDSGINSVTQLIDIGKNRDLSFATFGPGSSPHIYGATLQNAKNFSATPIAYKGSGDAIIDMLAGRIDFMFDSLTTSIGHVQSNKLIPLAITSKERSPLLPNTPTLAELGIDNADLNFWFALQVSADTDPQKVEQLRNAVYKATQSQDYINAISTRGVQAFSVQPQDLTLFFENEFDAWSSTAEKMGLKAN